MDNAFIKQIRDKRMKCIFFGITIAQNMNFLSKLSRNDIRKNLEKGK